MTRTHPTSQMTVQQHTHTHSGSSRADSCLSRTPSPFSRPQRSRMSRRRPPRPPSRSRRAASRRPGSPATPWCSTGPRPCSAPAPPSSSARGTHPACWHQAATACMHDTHHAGGKQQQQQQQCQMPGSGHRHGQQSSQTELSIAAHSSFIERVFP